jgi:hypothetical protein
MVAVTLGDTRVLVEGEADPPGDAANDAGAEAAEGAGDADADAGGWLIRTLGILGTPPVRSRIPTITTMVTIAPAMVSAVVAQSMSFRFHGG